MRIGDVVGGPLGDGARWMAGDPRHRIVHGGRYLDVLLPHVEQEIRRSVRADRLSRCCQAQFLVAQWSAEGFADELHLLDMGCLLYTSPSPRDS